MDIDKILDCKFEKLLVTGFDICREGVCTVKEAIELEDLEVSDIPIIEIENIYELTSKYLKSINKNYEIFDEKDMKNLINLLAEEYTKNVIRTNSWDQYNYTFSFENAFENGSTSFILIKNGDYYIDFAYEKVYTFSKNKFNFISDIYTAIKNNIISYEDMNEVSIFMNCKQVIKEKRKIVKQLKSSKDLRTTSKEEFKELIIAEVDAYIPEINYENDCIIENMYQQADLDEESAIDNFFYYLDNFDFEKAKKLLEKFKNIMEVKKDDGKII